MSDFIAKSKTEYISKDLSLTEDINNLVEIRKSLRQKALASPLFDTEKFGQDFGDLLSNVWLITQSIKKIIYTFIFFKI